MVPSEIAVIMPTLGRRITYMRQALDSLKSQEVRTRVILVAPLPSREVSEVAHAVDAVVMPDPGRGLSAAVNVGLLEVGSAEYVLWLNDDDYLLPRGLSTLSAMLDENRAASVAYGACEYVDQAGRRIGVNRAGRIAAQIQGWGPNLVPQPAALMRVAALEAAGDYDESLKCAMDLDMLLRLRKVGPFASTRREVAAFRWHEDAISVGTETCSRA